MLADRRERGQERREWVRAGIIPGGSLPRRGGPRMAIRGGVWPGINERARTRTACPRTRTSHPSPFG